MAVGSRSAYNRGVRHGRVACSSVRSNLRSFFASLQASGYYRQDVLRLGSQGAGLLASRWEQELAGIADGAGVPYVEILAYNLCRELVLPEECTVMFAAGAASVTGYTVFGKNSDKVGGESLVGTAFFRNKELNVVVFEELDNGVKLLGVTAAGTAGLKMGMSSRGLVGGGNLGRTEELYQRKLDLTQLRALDRTYLCRLGLEQEDILAAAELVAARSIESPPATSGNVTVADARQAYIIESCYDRLAIKKVVDDVDSRANSFVVLEYLNKKDDVSSMCRYWRTQEILKAKKGEVSLEDLLQISMDHANGPGPNSVCRHGTDFREEVSLSAMVVSLDGKDPLKSRFGIALGKPCHAWRDPSAHVFGDMTWTRDRIPADFYNGEVFKRFYVEDPRCS